MNITMYQSILVFILLIYQNAAAQTNAVELTAKDVEALQQKTVSEELPYAVRHEVAKSAVFWLMQNDRQIEAKMILMRFSGSLRHNESAQTNAIPPELDQAIVAIDEGKYEEARSKINAYIQSTPLPHESLSIIALKADHEPAAYYGLFADAKDESLSIYSSYVMGILLVRSQGLQQASLYFQSSESQTLSPSLNRWLKIDAAKFNLISGVFDRTHSILDELLKQNPKDAQALFWKARALKAQNQDERSREALAQLIPNLYPDIYLITESASLALQLGELNTAAGILTEHETKLNPSRDFYELFSIVRNQQNQKEESVALSKNALSLPIKPEPVSAHWIQTTRLQAVLQEIRNERRAETQAVEGGDPLDKAFLFLVNEDSAAAKSTLQELIKTYPPFNEAQFMLSSIHRREGKVKEALQTLQQLHKTSPAFRRYSVLSMMADYAVQLEDPTNAGKYYELIQKEFPESYQSAAAALYKQAGAPKEQRNAHAVKISPTFSKYDHYASAFVIKELMAHWDTHITFARISSQIGVSPRRGLSFIELFFSIVKMAQYSVYPFSANVQVVSEFLNQNIPIVFCKGNMFASQNLELSGMITGYDVTRKLVYFESVLPGNVHVLTEKELLEGICMAVYPVDTAVVLSDQMKQAFSVGDEFINLNAAAGELNVKKDAATDLHFDLNQFNERIQSVPKETAIGLIPLQLAVLKYQIQHQPGQAAGTAKTLQPSCENIAQYWFDIAAIDFAGKQYQNALHHIEKAIQLAPGNIRYPIGKARAYEKLGKLNEAIALCEQLREEYPHNPSINMHLLAFYEKAGDTKKMEAERTRLKNLLKVEEVKIKLDGKL